MSSGRKPTIEGCLRLSPDVRASVHRDGLVVIHFGKGTVFSANRAGARIWTGVVEQWNAEDLMRCISDEFNITLEIARRDAAAFIDQLKSEGLLIAEAR